MYTTEDNGLLNNFAKEPKMYCADAPSSEQQRNYLLQGAAAILLLASVLVVAVSVS